MMTTIILNHLDLDVSCLFILSSVTFNFRCFLQDTLKFQLHHHLVLYASQKQQFLGSKERLNLQLSQGPGPGGAVPDLTWPNISTRQGFGRNTKINTTWVCEPWSFIS